MFRRPTRIAIVLLFAAGATFGLQSSAPGNDRGQINSLLARISNQSISLGDALDPNLSPSQRTQEIKRFGSSHYELEITATGQISPSDTNSASLPVRVHYKADDGNALDVDSKASFVKRNGTWYFANFDFMVWSPFLVIVTLLFGLVGVGYAVMVLFLRYRLRKRGIKGLKGLRALIPMLWPSILSELRETRNRT